MRHETGPKKPLGAETSEICCTTRKIVTKGNMGLRRNARQGHSSVELFCSLCVGVNQVIILAVAEDILV